MMKRLHQHYHNMASWRVLPLEAGAFRIVHSPLGAVMMSAVIVTVCAGFAYALVNSDSLRTMHPAFRGVMGLCLGLGALAPFILLRHSRRERKAGDLLRYFPDRDLLELPRLGRSVDRARNRVSFSSEVYGDRSDLRHADAPDHCFEFNLVIDGERVAFLSAIHRNGFRKIRRAVEKAGFAVTDHQSSIKG